VIIAVDFSQRIKNKWSLASAQIKLISKRHGMAYRFFAMLAMAIEKKLI